MSAELFSFAGYWWLYLAFTGLVVALLAFDLTDRKAHEISFREAACWSGFWIALAAGFGFVLYLLPR